MSYKITNYEENFNPKYKATVYTAAGKSSGETLYYLHGAANITKRKKFPAPFHIVEDYEETNFETTTARNLQMLEQMGDAKPKHIVCISLGSVWMLSIYDRPGLNPKEIYVPRFKAIMDEIEIQHKIVPPNGKRLLQSHSMGGWNAMVLMAELPHLWSKSLVINPLIPCQPWHTGLPAQWALVDSTNAIILAEMQLKEKAYEDSNFTTYGYKKIAKVMCDVLYLSSLGDIFKFHKKVNELKCITEMMGLKNFDYEFDFGTHNSFDPVKAANFLKG